MCVSSVYPHSVCVCLYWGFRCMDIIYSGWSCWAVHMFSTFDSRHYENVQDGAHTMTAICLSFFSDDKRRSH